MVIEHGPLSSSDWSCLYQELTMSELHILLFAVMMVFLLMTFLNSIKLNIRGSSLQPPFWVGCLILYWVWEWAEFCSDPKTSFFYKSCEQLYQVQVPFYNSSHIFNSKCHCAFTLVIYYFDYFNKLKIHFFVMITEPRINSVKVSNTVTDCDMQYLFR